eukprot:10243969-Ditylum_brightwellii.AAC.1
MLEAYFNKRERRFLCIQYTGRAKTLLYKNLAAMPRGVTLYIPPLLSLGADQHQKLLKKHKNLSVTGANFDTFPVS